MIFVLNEEDNLQSVQFVQKQLQMTHKRMFIILLIYNK